MSPKYGARVYYPDSRTVHVKQTVFKEGRYVVDCDANGEHKEQHITIQDGWEQRLAEVIQGARDGRLPSKGEVIPA